MQAAPKSPICALAKKSGVEIACDGEGVPSIDIEISPLFASNEDDFVERWNALAAKPEIKDGFYLE